MTLDDVGQTHARREVHAGDARFATAMHAAVTTACRSRECDDFTFRFGCGSDQRHGRTRFTGRDARTRDHRGGHRTAHVEREQDRLAARFNVLERRVERFVQRVHHGRHRRPLERTLVAVALGVDLLRHEDRQRVNARTLERRLVTQLADDETLCVAERREQAEARHLAEVADHRRHRHAFEQRLPHNGFIEPLGRDCFTRQVEFRR